MATRAAIGMKQADGTIRAIYLHWDGYVAGAGAILGGWYKTSEQVTALLDLGDLSELDTSLEKCVAYHRDRHEPYREPSVYADKAEFQRSGKATSARTTSTSMKTANGASSEYTTSRTGSGSKFNLERKTENE